MTTVKDEYQVTSKTDDSGIEEATRSVTGLGNALKTVGKIGAAPFNAIKSGISGIGKVVGAAGKGLAVFGLAVKGMKEIGKLVGDALDALREKSPALDAALTKVQEGLAAVAGPLLEKIGNALVPIFEKLAEVIASPEFQKFVDTFTTFLINGLNSLMPVLEGVVKFLGDLFTAIDTGDWSKVWETIKTVAETAWNTFKGWFEEAWNTFWSVTVPGAWNTFKQIFQIAWDSFWNGIKNVAEGIWLGIKTAWDNFWGGLSAEIQKAMDWLRGTSATVSASATALGTPATRTPGPGMGGFASGAIVRSPIMAMVGDSPRSKGGEAIAPISDLMGMIRQAVGGGIVVNIQGPFGPGYTPAQAGAQAGDAIVDRMRSRGLVV